MTSVTVVLAHIGNAACSSGSGGPTLGTIVGELKQLVKRVETSARTLTDPGNVAVGQQQMLFASALRSTIEQFESAYSLNARAIIQRVECRRTERVQRFTREAGGEEPTVTKSAYVNSRRKY
jgi:hypothetical protein